MQNSLRIAVALCALCLPAASQGLVVSAGPNPVPIGAPVKISYTNTSDLIAGLISCPWRVLDAKGSVVYTPNCLPFEVLFSSLGVITETWNQIDNTGHPVPPGDYFIEGFVEFEPSQLVPVTVGGADANLTLLGLPNIGTADVGGGRKFWLSSPADREQPYWLLASLSNAGIETCGGTVPLALDPLLANTLSSASIITAGLGVLDGDGNSDSSRLLIPDSSSLVGLSITTAFVVLNLGDECPIRTASAPYQVTIQGGAIPFGS